jgi:hypothetical protein
MRLEVSARDYAEDLGGRRRSAAFPFLASTKMTNPWQRDKNPKEAPKIYKYVPPPAPTLLCVDCHEPVYVEFEYTEPEPLCLWCSAIRDDKKEFEDSA